MSKQDKSRLFTSFRLIRKLNLNDKIVESNSKGEKNSKGYLILFKVLNSMKSYDRKSIFIKMGEKGYDRSQVISFGNYLFYSILDIAKQKEKTAHFPFSLFTYIEILKDLEEYSEALALILIGKEKCEESEQFELYCQFLKEEIGILSQSEFREDRLPEVRSRIEDLKSATQKMDEIVQLISLYYLGVQLLDQKWSQSPDQKKTSRQEIISKIKQSKLLSSDYYTSSTTAKFLKLSISLILSRTKGNDSLGLQTSKKIISLFQKNQSTLSGQKEVYLKSLYQAGLLSIRLQEYSTYYTVVEKIQKLKDKKDSFQLNQLFYSILLEITFQLEAPSKYITVDTNIKERLDSIPIEDFSSYRIYLIAISSCLFFIHEKNWTEALRWINTALNLPSKKVPPKREIVSRSLQIICLIEKGQREVALARVTALRKFKNRRKLQFPFWNETISLLVSLCENYGSFQDAAIWSEFVNKIHQPIQFLLPFDLVEFASSKAKE